MYRFWKYDMWSPTRFYPWTFAILNIRQWSPKCIKSFRSNNVSGDTNLFYSHHDIKTLFNTVNKELEKLVVWFTSNKLSLNTLKKTKYTFFHKNSVKDNIPLKLPDLHIFDKNIERTSSIKFLGVMIDEHITWYNHINIIEKKTF